MRVVVAADRFPGLSSAQAGAAMATAWAELHAQVAVVPMGNALEGFQQALADLLAGTSEVFSDGTSVLTAPHQGGLLVAVRPDHVPARAGVDEHASSAVIGHALREAVDGARRQGRVDDVVLELGDIGAHDGGAGLLAALGATADCSLTEGVAGLEGGHRVDLSPVREWLGDARLTLVTPVEVARGTLVGLRGITSVRGHAAGLDPATLLATDQRLVDLAEAMDSTAASREPGAGAAGGVGHAVLALGGRVQTGAEFCRDLSRLPTTMRRADVVVTGVGQLDFGTMGGDVLTVVSAAAGEALRPLVVITEHNYISARELRSVGVEAAYSVRPEPASEDAGSPRPPVDADELTAASRGVAATWTW